VPVLLAYGKPAASQKLNEEIHAGLPIINVEDQESYLDHGLHISIGSDMFTYSE
jgi:hypothetical protein